MPTMALAAAEVSTTVVNVNAREPVAKRYASGTIRNSTSCRESMKLARGSTEKIDENSVMPAYASSGQKNRGASNRSCPVMSSPIQHTSATVSRICAAAIENCNAPATPASAIQPVRSRREPLTLPGSAKSACDSAVSACSMVGSILTRRLGAVGYPRQGMTRVPFVAAVVLLVLYGAGPRVATAAAERPDSAPFYTGLG